MFQHCKQDVSSRVKSRSTGLAMGLALFAVQSAFSLAAHAQTTYQITPLGSFGHAGTSANALNNVGEIVGCSLVMVEDTLRERAFVYRDRVMTNIGSLSKLGASCALDINDTGEITGTTTVQTPTQETRAFIYSNGTMTSLGDAGTLSGGIGINSAGLIAGYAHNFNGKRVGAFRYDRRLAQPQVDIGTLNGAFTRATGINAAGDIVGVDSDAKGNGTSFLYRNGALTDLGSVLGYPSNSRAINDSGYIVGTRTEGGYVYVGGTVIPLPPLRGDSSVPLSINNVGQIVGLTKSGYRAFVIDEGQIFDLNDVIAPNDPAKPFVTLESADDINDNGWIIAHGVDSKTGASGAYLLRPVVQR